MTHPFEIELETILPASPEQVWAAIATGPGIDSWFMGHTEIEPREGGRGHMTLMGFTAHSTVTAWEPGKRFAYRGDENPDGTFMAFEYIIEGREGADVTLVLTEWAQFRQLEPTDLDGVVRQRIVLDGRNCLDPAKWRNAGWVYRGVGRR